MEPALFTRRWWRLCLVVGLLLLRGAGGVAAQPAWPDRRPLAFWMIADQGHLSTINPRGYLWDATLNVFDALRFRTAVMTQVTAMVTRLNSYVPRPQGVLVWDLEGYEFPGTFTYVGHPASLPALAPEMDGVADEVFATLRQAGYRVGVTIRPQTFLWGTTLPATCTTGPTYQDWDVFIKLNDNAGPPTQRLYVCSTEPNVWWRSVSGYQRVSEDDAVLYETLRAKIQYAITRWGASFFYLDSTGYKDGHGTIRALPFQRLAATFPQVLLIPEFAVTDTWAVAAGYADNVLQERPSSEVLAHYPGAFAVGPVGLPVTGAGALQVRKALRARIRAGGIVLLQAWWDNPETLVILDAYRWAGQR